MKQNGLGKLYDRLTPEERFKLDIEATARGDEEESRHLTDSCPKREYRMNEVGYAGRWHGAVEITFVTWMDLARCLDKLQMIDAFRLVQPHLATVWHNDTHEAYFDGHMAGSRHAWKMAGAKPEGDPPGWESDDEEAERNADPAIEADLEKISARGEEAFDFISEALGKLEREFTREALSIWSAFSLFCEEQMELSAEKVLKAVMAPALGRVKGLEERAAELEPEIEPDPEIVEEYRTIMTETWPKYARGASIR